MTTDLANPPTPTGPDTRPEWMLDPSLTEVDHAVIDAVQARSTSLFGRGDNPGAIFTPETSDPPTTVPAVSDALPAGQITISNVPGGSAAGTAGDGVVTSTSPAGGSVLPPPSGEPLASATPDGLIRIALPDGGSIDLTQEQAINLLRQDQWLASQTPETLRAWGEVSRGQARAIPTSEVDRYQQWLAVQQAQVPGTPPTAPAVPQPQTIIKPDTSSLSPEQRAYVESLERIATAPIPQLPTTHPTQFPTASAPQFPAPTSMDPLVEQARIQAEASRLAEQRIQMTADLNVARTAVSSAYNLTADQLTHLDEVTAQAQVIPSITNKRRLYSRTGDLLSEAPFVEVLGEAYEYAMSTDPTLKAIRDEYVFNKRLAEQASMNQITDQKKARAGSLASAPSAAVSSGQIDPTKMTVQQTSSAIAAEIARAIADGTAGN